MTIRLITTEAGEKATQYRNVFAASFVFFCFSVIPRAIYYLGTLRLYTQSCRLFRYPGSKIVVFCAAVLPLSMAPLYAESKGSIDPQLCRGIVSLAPSVTELLYELGLGDHIVGVTKFCRYPKAALGLPKVGGYLDLNLERVVALKPTLVLGLIEGARDLSRLASFGIRIERLEHRTLSGIRESYERVSALCGLPVRFKDQLLERLKLREDAIKLRCLRGAPRKRFAIILSRVSGGVFYLSGSDGYYSDVVKLLGGENVNSGATIGSAVVGIEGLRKLRPDVIVEVRSGDDMAILGVDEVRDWWRRRMEIYSGGWDGGVVVLGEDYASVPGPRYIELAERLAAEVCGVGEGL